MATIVLTFPDSQQTRIENGFAGQQQRPDQVREKNGNLITNPESKTDFLRRSLCEWMKSKVVVYEADTAGKSAKDTARDTALSELDIT